MWAHGRFLAIFFSLHLHAVYTRKTKAVKGPVRLHSLQLNALYILFMYTVQLHSYDIYSHSI